jgi:DNA end-binding protein Ku
MIEAKLKGAGLEETTSMAPPVHGNVIDLMAALKRSIERPGETGGGPTKATPTVKSSGGAKKPAAKKAPAKKAPAKAAPARKRA